jgi:predicted lactoylglutathione lyase
MPAAISCVTFPVDDLQKSVAFYKNALGLAVEEQDEDSAIFDVDGISLTLMQRSEFGTYVERLGHRPAARGAAEMILSYFTESKGEVDALMAQVQRAGGQTVAASDEDGVYSGYFTDPDGHTWEVLFDGE